MLLAIFFALSLHSLTESAPIIPENATPKEWGITCQQFRTISSIIYSCLLTIFACTWTAVHPNLPGPNDNKFQVFGRRMKVVLVTLIAPEYTLFWALLQRRAAKELVKAAKEGELNPYSDVNWPSSMEHLSQSRARALDDRSRILFGYGRLRLGRSPRYSSASSYTRKIQYGVGRLCLSCHI